MNADRNLLFGIMAIEMDFIHRDQLIAAMHAWVLNKSSPLGSILVEQGALEPKHRDVLDSLVDAHVERHGSPQKSLTVLAATYELQEALHSINDEDISRNLGDFTLAHESGSRVIQTEPSSVGASTSGGSRFKILRPHARGGLGQVSVAKDTELGRDVALKEIQNRFADIPESRQRFVLEAEITGGLEHPGVVPVYGLGTYPDGRPYYAMRFIRGDSMAAAITRLREAAGQESLFEGERSIEFRRLLDRFLDVCNAVHYAHERRVLHRDLKPSNIMLGPYGETLVVDWGLAKPLVSADPAAVTLLDSDPGAPTLEPPLRPTISGSSTETQDGSLVGTLEYMSPEQADGRLDELDRASDVYSLGATLYHLLTGVPSIKRAGTVSETVRDIQTGRFPRPREVDRAIPRPLEAICLKAMELRKRDRYPTAVALADDLVRWMADEPVHAYPDPITTRIRRWIRHHRTGVAASAAACLVLAVSISAVRVRETWRLNRLEREIARYGVDARKQLAEPGGAVQALASLNRAKSLAESDSALSGSLPLLGPLLDEAESRVARERDEQQRTRMRRDFDQFVTRVHAPLDRARVDAMYGDLGAGEQQCRAAEQVYQARPWLEDPHLDWLEAAKVDQLRDDMATLYVLWAHVDLRQSRQAAAAEERSRHIADTKKRLDSADHFRPGLLSTAMLRSQLVTMTQVVNPLEQAPSLLTVQPTTALDWFLAGETERDEGGYASALRAYDEALRREPDHFWAQYMYGVCLFQQRALAQSVAAYDQAIRLRPSYAWTYLARALTYAGQGQWDAAYRDLDQAQQIDPEFFGVDHDRAVVLLAQAVSRDDEQTNEERLDLCRRAEAACQQALGKQPGHVGTLLNLAQCKIAEAKYAAEAKLNTQSLEATDKALQTLDGLIGSGNATPVALTARAEARIQRIDRQPKDLESALADLHRAVELDPNHSQALRLWAQIQVLNARQFVTEGRQANKPKARDALTQAAALFQRAAEAGRDSKDAWLGCGLARVELIDLVENEEAARTAEQALEDLVRAEQTPGEFASDRDTANLYQAKGVALETLGQSQAAMVAYGRALEADPQRAAPKVKLAWLEIMGPTEAAPGFDQALEARSQLDPRELAHALVGRGYSRAMKGLVESAVQDAEEAVTLAAGHWQVFYNAAAVYGVAAEEARLSRDDSSLADRYTQRLTELLREAMNAGLPKTAIRQLIDEDRAFIIVRRDPAVRRILD